MDTRNLIAFAMLLAVVVAGMMKGAISGADVKEVIILLSGGVIGFTMPRRPVDGKGGPPMSPPPAAVMPLLVGAVLLLVSCASSGPPPSPDDPTAPPPAVTLPKDPLAPPFTTFYQHADGGTDR